MTREEAITVLENEKMCFLQDSCEPCKCDFCRLMVPEKIILSAYNMAIAYIRETEKCRWIPVTERLPENDGKYICRYGFHRDTSIMFTGVLDYYATDPNPHWQHETAGLTVTHWMPLPEPPKEA